METRDYVSKLAPILDASTAEVADRLARFGLAANEAGDGVDRIIVEVFVDQDGEGPFDVWARFDGRAGFALDRRFDEERHLFGVEWGEDGWEPEVPGRPRGWTRDDLELGALTAVAEWVSPLIPEGAPEGFWQIYTPDGACA